MANTSIIDIYHNPFMGKTTDLFKNQGGEVIKTSGNAIKTILFVTVAAVALGIGVGAVSGGFSS